VDSSVQARYVNARHASAYLGISVFSVYRLVERRAIPFIPLHPSGAKEAGRASVRFDLRALDVWMQKQMVKPLANFIDELRPQK
jgi:predicted DNA-binding transcriptional regulator AlpA